MWREGGGRVVESGASPLRRVWRGLSAIQDADRSSKALRGLLRGRLSVARGFWSGLPVLLV